VLALAGVFVYHTLRPFDTGYWHVKYVQRSQLLTDLLTIVGSWGLPLFFLVAGASTTLALRWRTTSAYARERLLRLAVPLAVGWTLLGPVQLWLEEHHHGVTTDSLPVVTRRFLAEPFVAPPLVLAHSYALWFAVFLLEFSLVGLPVFLWLRCSRGQRLLGWLGRLGCRRGGALPLFVVVAVAVVPLAANLRDVDHGWGQWAYLFSFFLLGHVATAAPGLVAAIRRDVGPALALGTGGLAALGVMNAAGLLDAWDGTWSWLPVVAFTLIAAQAWGWVLAVWGVGMRSRALALPLPRLVGDAAMPFFVLHQPVILGIAFVVVTWELGMLVTWVVVGVPAFLVAAALSVALGRTPGVRVLLGVKSGRRPADAKHVSPA
jgi:glucans biosynthesis protein C